ncbi:OsmC family protein [Litchfieldella rifensis]|uniref:OsmC family protein n=1 Tax=Litchfieldella rifensis TaxID=762643 RepID=A0ABV7LLK7_9GAMM
MKGENEHAYEIRVEWTGNVGTGTSGYHDYSRNHEITIAGKPVLLGSADPAFQGDPGRYNPEELLVVSLSTCHMLWYLHLCADARIVVTEYVDEASGTMELMHDGSGHFTSVVLKPSITIRAGDDIALAKTLHDYAHDLCFIANSVNFPVRCEPQIRPAEST